MNQLEKVKALDAYEVKEWKTLKETRSEGIVLRHKKTGAKLFLLRFGKVPAEGSLCRVGQGFP